MDPQTYLKNALVTESLDYRIVATRLSEKGSIRLLHASLGLHTESGEIADAVKRWVFYGKPVDNVNLEEEAGDILWYLAVLCDTLGVSFEQVMEKNIAKLKARYGEKFTEAAALNRDLDEERRVLETRSLGGE